MEGRTQYRVNEVLVRVKKRRRRREHHLLGGLSLLCLLLTAGLTRIFTAVTSEIPFAGSATDTFAAMLLHEDAGGYVLVGVLAFSAGAAVAIACLWWHRKH